LQQLRRSSSACSHESAAIGLDSCLAVESVMARNVSMALEYWLLVLLPEASFSRERVWYSLAWYSLALGVGEKLAWYGNQLHVWRMDDLRKLCCHVRHVLVYQQVLALHRVRHARPVRWQRLCSSNHCTWLYHAPMSRTEARSILRSEVLSTMFSHGGRGPSRYVREALCCVVLTTCVLHDP
jgi:hypothetical protein